MKQIILTVFFPEACGLVVGYVACLLACLILSENTINQSLFFLVLLFMCPISMILIVRPFVWFALSGFIAGATYYMDGSEFFGNTLSVVSALLIFMGLTFKMMGMDKPMKWKK